MPGISLVAADLLVSQGEPFSSLLFGWFVMAEI